eukprot:scaffold19546_cov79-Phaeocystis_antarctica.AAC.4
MPSPGPSARPRSADVYIAITVAAAVAAVAAVTAAAPPASHKKKTASGWYLSPALTFTCRSRPMTARSSSLRTSCVRGRPGVYRVDHKQLAAAGVKLKNNSYETQVGAAKALARSPSPSMAPSPPHLIEPPCR